MSFSIPTLNSLRVYSRGKPGRDSVRMDMNENQSGDPVSLSMGSRQIRCYPDEGLLVSALGDLWKVPPEGIMLFNGASEAIMVACLAFSCSLTRALVVDPEFALIPHYLGLTGARLVVIPLDGSGNFDLPSIRSELETGLSMLMVSTPHNPTGALLPGSTVLEWCSLFPDTLFVIDEAYCGFSGRSLLREATQRPNLLVLRSFSKDWAMAGLRLGAAAGCGRLLNELRKVRTPYSVNAAALEWALLQLTDLENVKTGVRRHLEERDRLANACEEAGFTVRRGGGNFFLLQGDDAVDFCRQCGEMEVVLRRISRDMVRISPADSKGNERFIGCLRRWKERA